MARNSWTRGTKPVLMPVLISIRLVIASHPAGVFPLGEVVEQPLSRRHQLEVLGTAVAARVRLPGERAGSVEWVESQR